MIFGIGVDLVENRRLLPWLSQPSLLERYFTARELQDVRESSHPEASLAARFAAKEAFGKALGCGLRGLSLKEIEVQRSPDGKPSLVLTGKPSEVLKRQKVEKIHLSLSHEKDYAVAFVVLEL
jgi:holo-[acyl-carrier protein] synthase